MDLELETPDNVIEDESITHGLTDHELYQFYPDQVKSKRPFIYSVEDTDDPNKKVAHVAQLRLCKIAKDLDDPDSRWMYGLRILRCSQRNTLEVMQQYNIREGLTLKAGQTIHVRETTVARNEQRLFNPKQDSKGMLLLAADGQPIFRSVFVEYEGEGELDVVIDYRKSNIPIDQYREKIASIRKP